MWKQARLQSHIFSMTVFHWKTSKVQIVMSHKRLLSWHLVKPFESTVEVVYLELLFFVLLRWRWLFTEFLLRVTLHLDSVILIRLISRRTGCESVLEFGCWLLSDFHSLFVIFEETSDLLFLVANHRRHLRVFSSWSDHHIL